MKKLLKKEFTLCLHPAVPLFLALSALLLTPNYPYLVTFFYITLGIFFICMSGRENHDITLTMCLPVSRKELVTARILLSCILQMTQLLLCAVMVLIRPAVLGDLTNAAGMDANAALLGEGLLTFALFNIIFFPAYYRDVRKVGVPFVKASAALLAFVGLDIVCTYAVPFVRDTLDTLDPAHLPEKAVFAALCAAIYALVSWAACRLSVKRFERLDLQA